MHSTEKFSLSIVVILLSILVFVMVKQSHEDQQYYQGAIHKKWSSWIKYRDNNCKLTEKLIGVSMPNNRMAHTENANKYECNNGLIYTITESKDNDKGNLEDIPTIK